jgi:hypothetical protein
MTRPYRALFDSLLVRVDPEKAHHAAFAGIRAATTSMDRPIVTTVQELAAAVQGIEAQLAGEFTVKPLQEHARDLDLYDTGTGKGPLRSSRPAPGSAPATGGTA